MRCGALCQHRAGGAAGKIRRRGVTRWTLALATVQGYVQVHVTAAMDGMSFTKRMQKCRNAGRKLDRGCQNGKLETRLDRDWEGLDWTRVASCGFQSGRVAQAKQVHVPLGTVQKDSGLIAVAAGAACASAVHLGWHLKRSLAGSRCKSASNRGQSKVKTC